MTANKKNFIKFVVVAAACLTLTAWIAWHNSALEMNTYTVCSSELPEGFDGYRIAHVSDLHNAEMGEGNEKLLDMLRDAKPDMIAITGDLIDSRHTNFAVAWKFIEEAVKIAPCYYVTGNHESRVDAYWELKEDMEAVGVVVLEDARIQLTQGNDTIMLLGVNDPSFDRKEVIRLEEDIINEKMIELHANKKGYTVLLIHRPELFDIYVKYDVELALSGHMHGGQFRLPFVGGLASGDGLFPEYDAGLYTKDDTTMIVSRGIGNSLFPFRFNNPPELLLIELKHENPEQS